MRIVPFLLAVLACAAPAAAQDTETPYWASIRASEVNMRVGPGEDYKINWVYRRFVEDPGGAKGWVLARFLTRERTAIVVGQGNAEMREGGAAGKLLWRVQPGVVGLLGDCAAGWCAFRVGAMGGQIREDRLWGDGAP
jgi:SH3-like domain-containing protein